MGPRDITEQEQTVETLRRYQIALDHASDGVEWLDSSGRFIYVNQTTCSQLGYTSDELLTMGLTDIDPTITAERWAMFWGRLRQVGKLKVEALHRCKDGTTIPVEVSGTFLDFGATPYVCAFVRDISEWKRAEAERAALQQQIIAAQEAAIHELSTPLLPLDNHVLALPLVGAIDSTRAHQVMETLLQGVAAHRATTVIIDVTGVQVIDTQVANALIQAAQAVKLLGAQVVLTGIRPEIAQTLVSLGTHLQGIVVRAKLRDGIAYALSRTLDQQ